jgi:hypothetical protein
MWRLAAQPRDHAEVLVAVSAGAISGMNVGPERWRTGVGSTLLSAVHAELAADGAHQVAEALGVTVPEARYRRTLPPR